MARHRRPDDGFTIIELLVSVVIIGILATAALPMTHLAVQRGKEQTLRTALSDIRDALDAYKAAADDGRIELRVGDSGYPPSLSTLVEGVRDIKDPRGGKLRFLRRIPRDPFSPDTSQPPEKSWGLRSYDSEHDDPKEGADVFDVYSKASGIGLDGSPYRSW